MRTLGNAPRRGYVGEVLADEFLAEGPEAAGGVGIDGVRPTAWRRRSRRGRCRPGRRARARSRPTTDVAAPTSTPTTGGSDRRRRSATTGSIAQLLHVLGREVPPELGGDHARVHRVRVHTLRPVPTVELDRVEDVGGLRLPVRRHLRVLALLVVRVVPVDVRHRVAARAQHHDTRRRARDQQRQQAADEHEVAEVIRAEVQLEPVVGATERHRHDPGVGDQQVERDRATRANAVGEVPHARERAELEHLVRDVGVGHRRRAASSTAAVPLSSLRAVIVTDAPAGREGARRLLADARGGAGHEHGATREVDAVEHVGGRGGRRVRHAARPYDVERARHDERDRHRQHEQRRR